MAATAGILAFELLAKIAEAAEQFIAIFFGEFIQAINNDVCVALSCSQFANQLIEDTALVAILIVENVHLYTVRRDSLLPECPL